MRPTDQLPTPLPSAEPGGHLPAALLRQYVAGTLGPAAQYRVEAHTLDCQRCAEVLEGLEMTDSATTDQSLADLQSRLRTRVAQEAEPKPAAATWPWLQMAGVLLLVVASIVGWRLNQLKTETQSEPVAAVMRTEQLAARTQREAVGPVAPEQESMEQESEPVAAADALADVPTAKPARPARSVAAASGRSKARVVTHTRAARVAETSRADVAATQPEILADKVVADTIAPLDVAAATPKAAPPAPASVSLAQASGSSANNAAKMPPSAKTRSFTNSDTAAAAGIAVVRGRITDQASGQGLPGVTVLVKGTKQGVSTQSDGSFALPLVDSQSTLVIASIGYTQKEYKVTNPSAPLTLALASDTRSLSEVVVTRKGKMPPPPAVGPAPAGGLPAFHEYLKKELEYPEKALRDRTQGTVKLRFTVAATGTIEEVKVVGSLSKECDEEAIRLVQEGPAWFPAIINGRRAAQQVRISVPFQLP